VRQDTSTNRLDFTASVLEGYDDDVPKEFQPVFDPNSPQSGGFSTTLNATANYMWTTPRLQLNTTGASTVRHYQRIGEFRSIGQTGAFGGTARFSPRTSLVFNQAVAYEPTSLYELFPTGAVVEPGSTPATAPDYSIGNFESIGYLSNVGLRREITPRARLSADGTFAYTNRLDENPSWRDVQAHTMAVDYSQNVRRNTAFTMGYNYRKGHYGNAGIVQSTDHRIEGGFNHVWVLSGTRRTLFGFEAGVSGANIPRFNEAGFERQYFGIGQVMFGYDFGRSWMVRADFKRAYEYIVDLPTPVFADSFGASVAGLISRRVDFQASGGYSSGESLLARDAMLFDTFTVDVKARVAITRTIATYYEYLYYYYDFRGNTLLLLGPGVPPGLKRNGVRAGLTLWMPAYRR
jgi:hypothetical protein